MYDVGDAALVGVPCRGTAEMSGNFPVHVRVVAVCKTAILLVRCIHGHKSRVTPEFGVGTLMHIVPQDFQKIPLRMHQNTPFQAKNSFFLGRGHSPQTSLLWIPPLAPEPSLLDLPVCPAEFHPDLLLSVR